MMNSKIIIFLIAIIVSQGLRAQVSVLQDKSGASTIIAEGLGINVNSSDASVTLNIDTGYSKYGNSHQWGANVKFKSTDGTSGLFDGQKIDLTLDIGGYYGWSSQENTYFLSGKVSASNFNLLKTDNSNSFDSKEFYGGSISFGDNLLTSLPIFKKNAQSSSVILGGTLGFGRINNLSDLTPTDTYNNFSVTKNDTTTSALENKKSGFAGVYHTSGAILMNLDAYIFPRLLGGNTALGVYSRSQLSGYQPRTSAGIGFLFGQPKAPTNVNFALMYQFNDVFNQLGKENDFLKRGGINFIAGFKF